MKKVFSPDKVGFDEQFQAIPFSSGKMFALPAYLPHLSSYLEEQNLNHRLVPPTRSHPEWLTLKRSS
jgi:hypothetical protein